MSNTKTLLQRVQSRISKRRNLLNSMEVLLQRHYAACEALHRKTLQTDTLADVKGAIKDGAASQRLDKEIFQVLLAQERNKYAGHFRSKYSHWLADMSRMP